MSVSKASLDAVAQAHANKRRTVKQLAGLLAAACLGTVALAPGSAMAQQKASNELTKINVLANYTFHGRHSPFFVGLEKGFYKDAGFDITILPAAGSGAVISAVESGKADYGMADTGPVIQAVARGAKVKGVSVFMDRSTMGLASLQPYPTLESLKGAKIAASQADSARIILPILLGRNGLEDMPIDWQTGDASVYASLLLSKRTDAYTASIDGDIPALEKIAAPQNQKVYFSSFAGWGYEVYGYWMITSNNKLQNKLDEVKAFTNATAQAVLYAIDHPEEAAKIMVKHNSTLDYNTTLSQWSQSIKAMKTEYVAENGYGRATHDRLEDTIETIRTALKLTEEVSPEDVFQNTLPEQ